jgi:PKHD-type hydroxylase
VQLKYNYWCYRKALKKELCDKIISLCLKQNQRKANIAEEDDKEGRYALAEDAVKLRDCYISWINDPWIYDILNPFIHAANKKAGWNFQWDWNESSQFTVYNKNQFYGWHCDQLSTPYNDTNTENFNNKYRKLSLTLQLTSSSEYKGGDFQFKWFDYGKVKINQLKNGRELGTLIIFPSFLWHQVTPVTEGTRQSLVNWSIGKPFI